jgi:hypothetical protein
MPARAEWTRAPLRSLSAVLGGPSIERRWQRSKENGGMIGSARALVAAAQSGLEGLGFLINGVDEAGRLLAVRNGPYSRQELALQVVGPDRLKASMRVCVTGALVGVVRWQPTSMGLFGIPDEGMECSGPGGLQGAVDDVLSVMKGSVLPLLDRHPNP